MQKKVPRFRGGIAYWLCPTCKKWQQASEYYKDSRTVNRLKSQCKQCHTEGSISTRNNDNTRRINREYARRARKIDPDKFRCRERLAAQARTKNEKTRAREILNNAVKSGKIIKPTNCSKCAKLRKITAHHLDYAKPLEVVWLCYECHGADHRKVK